MKSFSLLIILLVNVFGYCKAESRNIIQADRSLNPLNFHEAISMINQKIEINKNPFPTENLFENSELSLNQFISNVLDQIKLNLTNEAFKFPNVSQDCLTQLLFLANGLSKSQNWALKGSYL